MVRKKRKKRNPSGSSQSARTGGKKYTTGELFIAALGGAMIILFLGIVITSILGE